MSSPLAEVERRHGPAVRRLSTESIRTSHVR